MNNFDYCGIIMLLRQLVISGICSENEVKKIAVHIVGQYGVDVILLP